MQLKLTYNLKGMNYGKEILPTTNLIYVCLTFYLKHLQDIRRFLNKLLKIVHKSFSFAMTHKKISKAEKIKQDNRTISKQF